MNLKYFHRDNLYYEAIKKMQPAEILLDIGCGIRPQDHVQARTHICCEPFDEYIDVCMSENRKKKNFIFLKNDWDGALNLFPKNSIDTIMLADVIEHPDGKDAWGLNGGKWQEHKSGWLPDDFKENEWSFLVSKEFHFFYHDGKKCEKPYGAFWGIYTKNPNTKNFNARKTLKLVKKHKKFLATKEFIKLPLYLFNKIKSKLVS